MVFWLVPPTLLVWSAAEGSSLISAAALAMGLSSVFWMLICYGMQIPPLYGLGYPLGTLMALYIVLRSTWRGNRGVEWRGRVYGKSKRDKVGEE